MAQPNRTKQLRSPFVAVLIIVGLMGLGILGGVLLALSGTPPDPAWKQWSTPPERVSALESMYGDEIYAVSVTGQRYACSRYNCLLIPVEKVRQLPNQCDFHLFEPPVIPGDVAVALELCQSGGEFTTQINLAALSDGSLWAWSKSASWADHLDELFFGLGGGGIGLVLGLIVVVVRGWRARPAGSPPIRRVQVLGRLCLISGVGIALFLRLFGAGVDFLFYVPLGVGGLIALGGVLLLVDRRAVSKQ
jgi:hypothetical protein